MTFSQSNPSNRSHDRRFVIVRTHLVGFTRFNLVGEDDAITVEITSVMHEPKASALASRGCYCSSERTKLNRITVLALCVTFRQSVSGRAKCTLATS